MQASVIFSTSAAIAATLAGLSSMRVEMAMIAIVMAAIAGLAKQREGSSAMLIGALTIVIAGFNASVKLITPDELVYVAAIAFSAMWVAATVSAIAEARRARRQRGAVPTSR